MALVDWDGLTVSFLHDPPDKALDIRRHESRASRYLTAALDVEVGRKLIKEHAGLADNLSAIAERLPMPTAGENGERAIGPEPDGTLTVRHPLSGQARQVRFGELDNSAAESVAAELGRRAQSAQARFIALWRVLPAQFSPDIPADTRLPDHSIWHHADATAATWAALHKGSGRALLSLSIGPVQTYIAAARSVRDLWTGSAVLSWLTFKAMEPILEELGPTSVLFPYLRGLPLMDVWIGRRFPELANLLPTDADRDGIFSLALPNRFLAYVPFGPDGQVANELSERCAKAARSAWNDIASAVHDVMAGKISSLPPGWDTCWKEQIDDFLEITTAILPIAPHDDQTLPRYFGANSFEEAWPDAGKVRKLETAIPPAHRPGYRQGQAGTWQALVEMSARLAEAERSVRNIPRSDRHGSAGDPKCSLFGSYAQLGPAGKTSDFWAKLADWKGFHGARFRRGERFCAIAAMKRLAGPAYLAKELGRKSDGFRFPDTATIAASRWLESADIKPDKIRAEHGSWSGQWLHWPRMDSDPNEEVPENVWGTIRHAKKDGAVPAYYAVLMMDADKMGDWLRGENAPKVEEAIHPKIKDYFLSLNNQAARDGLGAKRPVGTALHAAISEALSNFAVHVVPRTVERHGGTLIYAGGDDVLALLPTETVLACAADLRAAFSGMPPVNGGAPVGYFRKSGRDILMMGPTATLSAGVHVVHYKSDLRTALQDARAAEKKAKTEGRDRLCLSIARRSGEHCSATLSWNQVPEFVKLVDGFKAGASDRWAYRLRSMMPTLGSPVVPKQAFKSEMRRQIRRSESESLKQLGAALGGDAVNSIDAMFDSYVQWRAQHGSESATEDFVQLCQSASFLARSRDD